MGFLENCYKTIYSIRGCINLPQNRDINSPTWAYIHNPRPNRMITCQATFKY